ncbi:hypothetical protein LTR85_000560 [Meristemomyces frigidus]|nr:hypothetical protein LTR85_000560 [Meristemomyces frigidus]
MPKDTPSDVIFICIDCEAFEFSQDKVTEIGIAVLDTNDLSASAVASDTESVMAAIRCAHYRPVEYSNLMNKKRVKGCPDCFGFGNSTWIRLADAKTVLQRIFADPTRLHEAADFSKDISSTDRRIILVGHGLTNDEQYLRRIGFSATAVGSIVGHADTQVLAGMGMYALCKLLVAVGISAINLHNGGNDAMYTMQAMVKMTALEAEEPGTVLERARIIKKRPVDVLDLQRRSKVMWGGTATKGSELQARVRKNKAPKPPPTAKTGNGSATVLPSAEAVAAPAISRAAVDVGPKFGSGPSDESKMDHGNKKGKARKPAGSAATEHDNVEPNTLSTFQSAATRVADRWSLQREKRDAKAARKAGILKAEDGTAETGGLTLPEAMLRLSQTDMP